MSQLSYKPGNETSWPIADLHCHSCFSDGELTPEALLIKAAQKQLKVFAVTDHDTVNGLERLNAVESELTVINGIELTCFWGRRVVHIVGLGFDYQHASLREYLDKLDCLRQQRAEIIDERLVKRNIPSMLDAALKLAGDGQIGRPHFAQAMVEAGVVSNEPQAFNKYLGAGKPGDVKVEWPAMEEGIKTIHAAGGITVLAHPTKYNLTFTKIRSMVEAFTLQGGDGIEISYPGVESGHILQLDKLASKHNLLVSAGSDFHKTRFHWTGIGKYPRFESDNPDVLSILLQA